MVTKLADGRGQITLKGHRVDDDWETLIKAAAGRNGQTVADFVVDITRDAAQAIMKGQPALPAALPAPRIEDIAKTLVAQLADMGAQLAASQQAATDLLRREQAEQIDRLRRQGRLNRRRK